MSAENGHGPNLPSNACVSACVAADPGRIVRRWLPAVACWLGLVALVVVAILAVLRNNAALALLYGVLLPLWAEDAINATRKARRTLARRGQLSIFVGEGEIVTLEGKEFEAQVALTLTDGGKEKP